MKAQVTEINFNVMFKGKYKVTELHSLTEKGQKRKDIVFNNSDIYPSVKSLKVGDTIDLKMKKNGDFWNVIGVEKIVNNIKEVDGSSVGNYNNVKNITDKDEAIARMSVLKTATDLVTTCLEQGIYKKTIKPEILLDEIFKFADKLKMYVSGEDKIEALESTMDDISSNDDESDDCPFE
jgi:hypothetical protein